jgi:hypothetical protein
MGLDLPPAVASRGQYLIGIVSAGLLFAFSVDLLWTTVFKTHLIDGPEIRSISDRGTFVRFKQPPVSAA